MIEEAPSSRFYISILDQNGYSVLITIDSQTNGIKMLQLSKEKYFVFNKFHLVLTCLYENKMIKIVTKYVVCYSNNKCFKGKI